MAKYRAILEARPEINNGYPYFSIQTKEGWFKPWKEITTVSDTKNPAEVRAYIYYLNSMN